MKKQTYIVAITIFVLLGALGGSSRLMIPLLLLLGFIGTSIILFDYQKSLYFIGIYILLDYFIRNYIGIPILESSWDELMFIVIFALWIYKLILYRKENDYILTPLDIPIILFVLLGGWEVLVNSPNTRIAIEGLRVVIQYIFWYFLIVQMLKTEKEAKRLYIILFLIGFALGAHGVYQYIVGVEIPQNWVDSLEKGLRTRVFSIVKSPNVLGSLMTLTIPMGISLIFAEKKIGKKIFYTLASLIMIACLIFTFSRGAWLGFIAAITIFILLKDKRLIIPAIFAVLLIVIFVPTVVDRMAFMLSSEYINKSLQGGRLTRWLTGIEMLKNQPFLGVGLGHFGGAVAMNNDIAGTFYMDNYYLKTAVEMGIVGLLAFLWLMYQVVIWSYRTFIKIENTYYKNIVHGALAGIVGVIVHNLFENIFEVPMMVTYFWLLAGIVMFLRCKLVKNI